MNTYYSEPAEYVMNSLFYLKEQCDKSFNKIKTMVKTKTSSGTSENFSDDVNSINQLFEKFIKAYDELCEADGYTPNWK